MGIDFSKFGRKSEKTARNAIAPNVRTVRESSEADDIAMLVLPVAIRDYIRFHGVVYWAASSILAASRQGISETQILNILKEHDAKIIREAYGMAFYHVVSPYRERSWNHKRQRTQKQESQS